MPRKPKPLTAQQRKDWDVFCDDIDGNCGPVDPDDINIAFQVEEMIKLFGFDGGIEHAEYRAQCAFHEVDREDWFEVVRILRERKAAAEKK